MADIGASNWTEADASNNTAAPDGMPEGMAPSGVNDWGRAAAGAIKRWYNQTIPLLTGGTSTAYTLSYTVNPGALVDGMTHLVRFHAANGAAATLNVGALGAKPIYCYAGSSWVAAPLGMLAADQIVRVSYNVATGAYFLLDLPYSSAQSPSGVSVLDFMIPVGINHISCVFELEPGTNAVTFSLQAYGAGSVLDTTAGNYYWNMWAINTVGGTGVSQGTGPITLSGVGVDNGSVGFSGDFTAANIQAAKYTKFNFRTSYQNGGNGNGIFGYGHHSVAAAITGVRFLVSAGTFSGKVTLTGTP